MLEAYSQKNFSLNFSQAKETFKFILVDILGNPRMNFEFYKPFILYHRLSWIPKFNEQTVIILALNLN